MSSFCLCEHLRLNFELNCYECSGCYKLYRAEEVDEEDIAEEQGV